MSYFREFPVVVFVSLFVLGGVCLFVCWERELGGGGGFMAISWAKEFPVLCTVSGAPKR